MNIIDSEHREFHESCKVEVTAADDQEKPCRPDAVHESEVLRGQFPESSRRHLFIAIFVTKWQYLKLCVVCLQGAQGNGRKLDYIGFRP